MRNFVKSSIVILIFLSLESPGKQSGSQDKIQVVLMSREQNLSVIVYQPDCPLEFKEASVFGALGGGGYGQYKVRNRSNKPIAEISLATIGLSGDGDLREFKAKDRSEWVMPGQLWPQAKADGEKHSLVETVPLTDEIRQQHKIGPPMKGIVIFMVVRVKFADGSVYSDERVYKELQSFCEDIVLPKR